MKRRIAQLLLRAARHLDPPPPLDLSLVNTNPSARVVWAEEQLAKAHRQQAAYVRSLR